MEGYCIKTGEKFDVPVSDKVYLDGNYWKCCCHDKKLVSEYPFVISSSNEKKRMNSIKKSVMFEISESQIDKFEKWKKKMMKLNPSMPTAGERWTFCFTPTGLGTIVNVVDEVTNEKLDLTEWEYF